MSKVPAKGDKASLPLVSVLVVTYRQEAFIRETMDSVLAQDYPNIEIVVTDDASPDGTQAILKDYAAKHSNIKLVLGTVNKGLNGNINQGLTVCTGELLCPFAGDDLMMPGKIRKQVDVMVADPDCALCYHNMAWFDSGSGETLRLHYEAGRELQPTESKDLLFAENFIGGPAVMLRRAFLPKEGYSTVYPFAADWLTWMNVAKHGSIRYLNEVLVRYRRHEGNETRLNMKVGVEQLAFAAYVAKTFPEAPKASLRRALALAHSAGVVGALGQGKALQALVESFQTMRYGRVNSKVLIGTAMAGAMTMMPKRLRMRLWDMYAARRFR
jgi:glycosyltransferase involved in cell wall biosynthesis/F0F1-type ATP synthase membrane subunit c/vacuolar-type H+-ATPase subunit K